ncbi:hypothetical protein HPB47_023936 [Ixodes persulcatus]|uniref:Uncharacterized protein n=1 Tax=Ixodes persulcatus TaxID=34615 RepID=A0AC60Q5M3_IXOPE|nr:hypothetical protein HPB47_023936 [Ixodes persulcatus]
MRKGSATVPVADCSTRYYDSQLKNDMKMSEYLDYWQGTVKSEQTSMKRGCLYLKDWHFVRDFANYEAYVTPVYFTSDWLNEFWGERTDVKDDCRFVYMGPKGSWTPFHADVFGSYSWSANVCGRKLWHLFPPGDEDALRDSEGKLPYDVTLPECARSDTVKKLGITVTQEAGEVIFVPSGWHHQVHNLEDTISINHNWFNGCNIDIVWKSLLKALDDVEKEICELRDTEGPNAYLFSVLSNPYKRLVIYWHRVNLVAKFCGNLWPRCYCLFLAGLWNDLSGGGGVFCV